MGKTIAQELFAIAEAQGGTASGYPRTIAGAVDALTDALAGSDVDSGRTIAEAVAVMGEYIGGGGGSFGRLVRIGASADSQPIYVEPLEIMSGSTTLANLENMSTSAVAFPVAGGIKLSFYAEFTDGEFDQSKLKAGIYTSDLQKQADFTDFEVLIDEGYLSFITANVPTVDEDGMVIVFDYS